MINCTYTKHDIIAEVELECHIDLKAWLWLDLLCAGEKWDDCRKWSCGDDVRDACVWVRRWANERSPLQHQGQSIKGGLKHSTVINHDLGACNLAKIRPSIALMKFLPRDRIRLLFPHPVFADQNGIHQMASFASKVCLLGERFSTCAE